MIGMDNTRTSQAGQSHGKTTCKCLAQNLPVSRLRGHSMQDVNRAGPSCRRGRGFTDTAS